MILLFRLVFLALAVLLWWAASHIAGPNLIPTPATTLAAAVVLFQDRKLAAAVLDSVSVYFAGVLLAAGVAIPFGLLMGGIRILGKTLEVYVYALSATPRVAFIPLVIVLLGLGFEAKVAIIFLGAVMPMLINTYTGVLNTDGELIEMARSTGAGRARIFWKIMLPGALPFIVAGLRLGATIGLINTVVAELYTAVRGLGGLLAVYGNTFQMAPYFVIVLILAAIGGLVTQGLKLIETRMDRWRYEGS